MAGRSSSAPIDAGTARRRLANSCCIGSAVKDYALFGRHTRQGLVELGVDQERGGTGVVDYVLDLVGQEPEIDRDKDPTISAHPRERDQEPG